MKLLLDQNLSHRLLDELESLFPDSTQTRLVGMERAEDTAIWQYAKEYDFTIVTKDSDFHEYSVLYGPPPKVIWLRCGNTSTEYLRGVLMQNHSDIEAFLSEAEAYCLELY